MFLTYKDLAKLFPETKGIRDVSIEFQNVSPLSGETQPKGLYIPLLENANDLKEAIENGAIAALWDKEKEIPPYTPNHFPIFLTNDVWKGYREMLLFYKEKLDSRDLSNMDRTNFLFLDKKLLNASNPSYDIAVMEDIKTYLKEIEGRG